MSVDLPMRTERLLLRAWTPDDVDAAFGLLGCAATMGQMRAGRASTRADAAVWVARRIDEQAEHGFTMWAVEVPPSTTLIGACGLFPKDTGLELGYIIDHRHAGLGYAIEAATAVCAAARGGRPEQRIIATIRPHNAVSIRVAQRAGLRFTAEVADDAGTLLVYEF